MRNSVRTVQDLIDELNLIKDKTKNIIIDSVNFQDEYCTVNEVEEFDDDVYIWLNFNKIVDDD